MTSIFADIALILGLLLALQAVFEIGYFAARRARGEREPGAAGQVGAIQGAVLGLLGLLLAFSFAGATQRFIERQDLITQEANAIGTAYLRTDVLPEPHRTELRQALRDYTRRRIEVSRGLQGELTAAHAVEVEAIQTRIWNAARAGVDARPEAMRTVLDPINQVIDMHSTRIAAGRKHLPIPVIGLLFACSALASAVMGYGSGMTGHRRAPLTVSLTLLIALSLWVTIDLDHPRAGLLRLNDAPLEALTFDSAGP